MFPGPDHRVQLLVLAGPYLMRGQWHDYDHPEVFVGRREVGQVAAFVLGWDPNVGRRHARLCHRGDAWFLEDLGSKNGTEVDGSALVGENGREINAGAIIRTGSTTWTLATPSHWLCRWESVLVRAAFRGWTGPVAHHCRLPPLTNLEAHNFGPLPSRAFDVLIATEGLVKPALLCIDSLHPGQRLGLATPTFHWHGKRLARQTAGSTVRITATVHGVELQANQQALDVVGAHDWVVDPQCLKTLAAFVTPERAAIRDLVAGVVHGPAQVMCAPRDRDTRIAQACYETLAAHRKLRYVLPSVSETAAHRYRYQPISLLAEVLGRPQSSAGNCLDLSLLMASCFEAAGLAPVVLLLGDTGDTPHHALAAYWVGGAGNRLTLPANRVRCELDAGGLVAVEATGITDPQGESPGPLSFESACQRATESIEGAASILGVDISLARLAPHSISPTATTTQGNLDPTLA